MADEIKSSEMSPVKQALQAVKEMQAKIAGMEMAKSEPIAVVGMACRFPGNANSPEELWELLKDGVDGIIDVPKERWDGDSFYDADPETPGKMVTRKGGFLSDIDQFDPGFFGISPREANSMDPHQRLLLQTTWQALENGGFDINGLYGSRTGVYVGISNFEYGARLLWPENPDDITAYSGTGGSLGVTAGRLSYTFGFTGPSMIIDTACSSSLVTTHLAMQALRLGECDMALSAGVNLIFGPQTHINFSKARMLAPDGHCKTFSADADGYARGEGVGVIMLKRLSDAERDNDNILALLRGSAVNQDGPSGGLTVPNGPSQVKVIKSALQNARLNPEKVGYIEAHGTGTPLGDPIEIGALASVFGKGNRPPNSPLYVSSIKTNIGHLESAAGIAGIIKTILSVQNGQIPPHQNFKTPNPQIDWDTVKVTIPGELTEWVAEERIAGVSSFSFSGTNAHLILSNYQTAVSESGDNGQPGELTDQSSPDTRRRVNESLSGDHKKISVGRSLEGNIPAEQPSTSQLMVLSSVHEANLKALSQKVADDLKKLSPEKWSEYCISAAGGRGHFNHRLALVAGSASEASDLLKSGTVISGKRSSTPRRIAFMFTGQGSQYINMGRQLFEEEPIFRSIMEDCDAIVSPLIGRSMLEMLYPDQTHDGSLKEKKSQNGQDQQHGTDSRNGQKSSDEPDSPINKTEYTQPLLFSVEYALAQLWRSWGIEPDALIGHSLGELTAATVSGLWSLTDALTLVCSRGSLMADMCSQGAMAAITMSEKDVTILLKKHKWASGINIASVNGPESLVVAGDTESIDRFMEEMTSTGIEVKRLRVSHAFHSPLVEPMIKKFGSVASGVSYGKLEIPVILNITGDFSDTNKMADAGYWQEHIRQPVRFYQGLSRLLDDGFNTFIEIGPKPTLSALGQVVAEDLGVSESCNWLPSMRYRTQPRDQLLSSLGQLYVTGVDAAASAMNTGVKRYPISLPTTPFVTDRYWYKHTPAKEQLEGGGHPLLGRPLSTPLLDSGSILYVNELSINDTTFLAHHQVFGEVVLPAAAHLEMGLAASNKLFSAPGSVRDVTIQQALVLPDDAQTPVQTVVQPSGDGFHFDIYSRPNEAEPWQKHTSGELSEQLSSRPDNVNLDKLKKRCNEEVDVETYYRSSRALGIEHGEDFQALKNLWQGKDEMLGRLELPSGITGQTNTYLLSPVLLDAAFQMASYPLMKEGLAYLPTGLELLNRFGALPREVWCLTKGFRPSGLGDLKIFETDIQLFNERGEVLAEITGLRFQRAAILPKNGWKSGTPAHPFEDWLYEINWKQKPLFGFAGGCLQAPDQISKAVSGDMERAVKTCSFYAPLFADMDRLATDFIQKELLTLEWNPAPGVQISVEDLTGKAGVTDEFHPLFNRCLGMLEEDGYFQRKGDSLQVLKPFELLTAKKISEMRERFSEAGPEMTLFFRCAESLGDVWRGDVDPLNLLFPQGDLTVTTLLYQHSVGARSINSILAESVRVAISNIPASQGVRILEIGGGTGGTTAHLLPILPADRCDYLFTDISAHFTKQASKEFGSDYPFMRFDILDIEKEPASDLNGKFDLIIAANVVHATRQLGQTLENCKSLLAPGGQLVLLEASAKQRWLDLTFGMTDGWWRFTGHDSYRTDYPLLSPDQWKSLLPKHGFGAVNLLGPDTASGKDGLKQHVVIASIEDATSSNNRTLSAVEDGHWLIVGEDSESIKYLKDLLPGETIVMSSSLITDDQTGTNSLKEVLAGSVKGIIMMHAIDSVGSATSAHAPISDPLSQQHRLVMPVLHLARALVNRDHTSSTRLWMVTQDAIAFGGGGDGFSQASLHGLVRTLTSEHPGLKPVAIDLPSTVSSRSIADAIWLEVQSGESDEQVACREDVRWVSRLVRSSRESVEATEINEKASYLITGGLGDIGLKIAQYLVQKGAHHLILMSRSKPNKQTKLAISELEKTGATIEIANCDVTDEAAVDQLINRPGYPPLRGVIHAAGTLADGILAKMKWDQFESVLSAKIAGAWNLHQATAGKELDFFILFSSIGSIFGPAAQGNYAAANACIDQFAGFRRQQGLPALVINWGAWSEIGLAARQTSGGQVGAMKGITPISPTEGVNLFDVLRSEQGQIVAVPANWPVLFEFLPEMALLEELRQKENEKPVAVEQKSSWLARLHELPSAEQHDILLNLVSEQVAQVLGAKVDSLDVTAGFFDLGMDSLTSVEMRNALQKSLGRDLPSTLIFKYPTIAAVTGYLAEQIIENTSSNLKTTISNGTGSEPSSDTGNVNNTNESTDGSLSNVGSQKIGSDSMSKSVGSADSAPKHRDTGKSDDDVNEMTEEELNALINDEFDNMMGDES